MAVAIVLALPRNHSAYPAACSVLIVNKYVAGVAARLEDRQNRIVNKNFLITFSFLNNLSKRSKVIVAQLETAGLDVIIKLG